MHRALSLSMILSVSASIKKGKKRIAARLTALAMTGSGKTDCHSRLHGFAMTEQQLTAHHTTFATTKRSVILSAKHERIRNSPLKEKRIATGLKPLTMTRRGETDCRTPCGGLACRLGRCFCFAEVSTGHPHRNDSFFVCSAL